MEKIVSEREEKKPGQTPTKQKKSSHRRERPGQRSPPRSSPDPHPPTEKEKDACKKRKDRMLGTSRGRARTEEKGERGETTSAPYVEANPPSRSPAPNFRKLAC